MVVSKELARISFRYCEQLIDLLIVTPSHWSARGAIPPCLNIAPPLGIDCLMLLLWISIFLVGSRGARSKDEGFKIDWLPLNACPEVTEWPVVPMLIFPAL